MTIYYVERHPILGQQVAAALFPGNDSDVIPVISDLTRMECRVLPLRLQDRELLDRYDAFFSLPECGRAALDCAVFDLATHIRAQDGLKTPDALHLAAALRAGCNQFWTQDDRLAKAAAQRIQVVVFDISTSGDPHV